MMLFLLATMSWGADDVPESRLNPKSAAYTTRETELQEYRRAIHAVQTGSSTGCVTQDSACDRATIATFLFDDLEARTELAAWVVGEKLAKPNEGHESDVREMYQGMLDDCATQHEAIHDHTKALVARIQRPRTEVCDLSWPRNDEAKGHVEVWHGPLVMQGLAVQDTAAWTLKGSLPPQLVNVATGEVHDVHFGPLIPPACLTTAGLRSPVAAGHQLAAVDGAGRCLYRLERNGVGFQAVSASPLPDAVQDPDVELASHRGQVWLTQPGSGTLHRFHLDDPRPTRVADGLPRSAGARLAVADEDEVYLLDPPAESLVRVADGALHRCRPPAELRIPWASAITGFVMVGERVVITETVRASESEPQHSRWYLSDRDQWRCEQIRPVQGQPRAPEPNPTAK